MEERKELFKLRLFALGIILVFSFSSYIMYKNKPNDNTSVIFLLKH